MTKNILKVLALAAFAAVAVTHRAQAANLGDAQNSYYDETANGGSVVGGANVTKGVNLFFTGKTQAGLNSTSSGSYVTISATAMTFYQPFGTVDTSVGTSGVVTYASTLPSNTMGALCDYINGLGVSYKCALQALKRDDPPSILKTQTSTDGTNNLAANGGFSVLITTTNFVSLGITPVPGGRVVLKQCFVNGQDSGSRNNVYVYGQLRKYGAQGSAFAKDPFGVAANDTYQVWASSTVQNTNATVPTSNATPRWLEFAKDAHVVVRVGANDGAGVQTSANFVNCLWDER